MSTKLSFKLGDFDLDHGGIADIAKDAAIAGVVMDHATRAATIAKGLSHSTRFTRGITVAGPFPTGHGYEAAYGSTYPFAAIVEFGSVNNPPQRALTNAARAAGLDFEDTPA